MGGEISTAALFITPLTPFSAAAALHLIAGYIFLGIWPMGIWGVEKFKLQPAPIFLL